MSRALFDGFALPLLVSLVLWVVYLLRVRRFNHQIDLAAEERLRVARELHDTLLQGVLSTSMQLHVAVDRLRTDDPALPLFTRVVQLMRQVSSEGRNFVRQLHVTHREVGDLERALSNVPHQLAPPPVAQFSIAVNGAARCLHPLVGEEVYWIGREALLNAFRHSGANRIELELLYCARQLRLVIRDDGCGIQPQLLRFGREGHWGLRGMRERAAKIASDLRFNFGPDRGTEVELRVPGRIVFRSPATRERAFKKWLPHYERIETDPDSDCGRSSARAGRRCRGDRKRARHGGDRRGTHRS